MGCIAPGIARANSEFLKGPFERLEGWCEIEAAAITLYLQRFRLAQGWRAPNCEIGGFRGEYLSVRHFSAPAARERTSGIHMFTVKPRVLGVQSNLTVIERDSGTVTASELAIAVGAPASWISVDGAHTLEGVHRDLLNAEGTLAY